MNFQILLQERIKNSWVVFSSYIFQVLVVKTFLKSKTKKSRIKPQVFYLKVNTQGKAYYWCDYLVVYKNIRKVRKRLFDILGVQKIE